MKTRLKYTIALAVVLAVSLVVCGGLSIPAQAAVVPIVVSGTQWGESTCFIAGTEGSANFNIADFTGAGINAYRIWGGTSRWEWEDDDGVYGSPSIAEIKADPNAVNWAWWDNVMTNPPSGTDYWWSDPAGWQGSAVEIFQALKDNGIKPVLTVRNVDNNDNPDWAQAFNPPTTADDWNEWWEHVFATVYWLNVRNDYQVDEYQIHNEPNNASQGWDGTIEDYYVFMQYTWDAITYVYDTYLPGRTYEIGAPVTTSGSSWPRDVMINAGQYMNVVDIHNYNTDVTKYDNQAHGWMDLYGHADSPLEISEWGEWRQNKYDTVAFSNDVLIRNMIRMSQPGADYVTGSYVFSWYDWTSYQSGIIHGDEANPVYTPGYYAYRMSTRALQGCRPTYQATEDNRYLVAIAAKDESGDLYFIVTSSSQNSIDVDVDLSAHLTSGTGTMYEFSSAYLDEVVGTPELANGHLNFTIPGHASILLEFGGGPPPPTDTPAPPTDTPEPQPTDTPGGPTDTPEPGGVMHVGDITMGCASQAVFHWATATVTILDASDQPVGTATVYGSFSGASSSSESDDTAGDGTVSFDATKVKNGGTWTFTVDDVVKSGWTYDEGSNVETSDSITCP